MRKLNRRWAELTVPKAGRVQVRLSRPVPAGKPGMARVTLDGKGHWHVSFPAPQAPLVREPSGAVVGVDRGVATTIATSDGQMLRAPVMRTRERRRLASLERRKARQRKGSKRRNKTKAHIARLHQAVADRRRNWIEVQTTRLVRDYDLIAVERLPVRNMVRRPKPVPDPDNPGGFLANGAAAKAGLNRSIHAQGWSMWLRRLGDKAEASGVAVEPVDPRHTSDECRGCGHTDPVNRESQAVFRCRSCGHTATPTAKQHARSWPEPYGSRPPPDRGQQAPSPCPHQPAVKSRRQREPPGTPHELPRESHGSQPWEEVKPCQLRLTLATNARAAIDR
ncbi:MAG: RNA-guided endonuclease InsQ/TnpB family protein [Acidimicrobiales bacterium]